MEDSKWSHLPFDILLIIANRLSNHHSCTTITPAPKIHNLRLRSVCKSWRSSVPLSPPPPTPVIVPFPLYPNRFSLSHSTLYLLQHTPPSSPSSGTNRPSSSSVSSAYWLLRVENNADKNNKFRPLDPLSKTLVGSENGLPEGYPKAINLLDFRASHVHTFHALEFVDPVSFEELKLLQPSKVAVSNPVTPVVVMAISGPTMWVYKLGDSNLREVNRSGYKDVVFHKGKFYAVDNVGKVVSFDVTDVTVVEIVSRFSDHIGNFNNLVVCNDKLYLVHKYYSESWYDEYDVDYSTMADEVVSLKIYELNEERREWEKVHSLDDHVFIVGHDCSYSISGRDFPGIMTNCVYFLDDSFIDDNESVGKHGKYFRKVGVYCFKDKSCGPLAHFPYNPLFWPVQLAEKPLDSKKN